MKNRFRKALSTLLAIALLVSGIMAVFAEEEAPVTVEETVTEAAQAAEEAPVQDNAAAAEETSYNNEASAEADAPAAEAVNTEAAAPAETEAAAPAETTAEEPIATAAETDVTPAAETEADIPEESNNAPAQEDAPTQEDAPAAEAEDESADEAVINEETASEGFVDELANDTTVISKEDTQVMGDDGGYIDSDVVNEKISEITPEKKYDGITELKIGSKVSGIAGDGSYHYIRSGKTQNVVLGLYADSDIQVKVNEKVVKFTADENIANYSTCELKLSYGETYIIELTGAYAAYTLTAEAKATEETAEATDEQSATPAADEEAAQEEATEDTTGEVVPAEDNNEETDTVDTVTDETENDETVNPENDNNETENTEDDNNENVTAEDDNNETEIIEGDNNETENTEDEGNETEEAAPAINAWIESDNTEVAIGNQITLTAAADIELDNAIAWMTSTDGEEWHKAGYGLTLTVDLTEENINNSYFFKMADGTVSDIFQMNAVQKQIAEDDLEAVEEQTATEEAVEEEIIDGTDEIDDEIVIEQTESEEEIVEEEEKVQAWVSMTSTLDSMSSIVPGTTIVITAEMHDVNEGEKYIYQWQFSNDGGVTYQDVEGANDLTYSYQITLENYNYKWQIVATLIEEDMQE